MRTLCVAVILAGTAALAGAQDRLADQLKKGIIQEETGQNSDKAIQTYKAILARYDEDRQAAATAAFRLAEVYRKAGLRAEAQAAYQRVVREFSDQTTLVDQSRRQLMEVYGVTEPRATRESQEMLRMHRDLSAAREELERTRVREGQEVLRMQRDLSSARAELERSRTRDLAVARELSGSREPVRVSDFSANQIATEDARRELAMLEKRMADMKARIEIGTAAPLDMSELQASHARVQARYEQLVKERENLERSREAGLALNYKTLKSIEAEIALVEKQVQTMQQKSNAGLISPGDPQLLQLQRELLALQRKADEIKAAIAVNSIK